MMDCHERRTQRRFAQEQVFSPMIEMEHEREQFSMTRLASERTGRERREGAHAESMAWRVTTKVYMLPCACSRESQSTKHTPL